MYEWNQTLGHNDKGALEAYIKCTHLGYWAVVSALDIIGSIVPIFSAFKAMGLVKKGNIRDNLEYAASQLDKVVKEEGNIYPNLMRLELVAETLEQFLGHKDILAGYGVDTQLIEKRVAEMRDTLDNVGVGFGQ